LVYDDLLVNFFLEKKSNQKIQGQPDRSARLSGQRHGVYISEETDREESLKFKVQG
jgi:hypothetical protein